MKKSISFESQRVILITGASSGLGKTTAMLLARSGHIVYGTSRKALPGFDGIRMLAVDVIRPDSIRKAVEQIIAEQGRLDVLINNAGLGISGALELATEEEIGKQMNTNFMGVVHACQAVIPVMRQAGRGLIITISSIGGVIAVPFQGFYSASKFAVEGYSEALLHEVRPFGIRICLVEPGDFCTNFTTNRSVSSATLDHPDYRDTFTRVMATIENMEKSGSHPDKLARCIERLIRKKHPPFRTKTGPMEQVLFARCKGWLPDRLVHWVVRTGYQINHKPMK